MQLLQTLHVHVEVLCLRLNDSAQQCLRICDLDRTLHLVECPQSIPHAGSCRAVSDVRQLRWPQVLHDIRHSSQIVLVPFLELQKLLGNLLLSHQHFDIHVDPPGG